MTDAEFVGELRRGLLLIMRAIMKRYHLSWADFLPRDVTVTPVVYVVKADVFDVTEK